MPSAQKTGQPRPACSRQGQIHQTSMVAGRNRRTFTFEKHCASISYAAIYRGIYAGMFDEAKRSRGARGAARNLRHKGKTRHKKGYEERREKIYISNELSARPRAANHRRRLGDWEGNTVAGKTGRACLVTLVDRKNRFATGGKADKKNACEVNRVMIRALQGLPVKTITPNRGKEFARHAEVTSVLQASFYFPEPHRPWQRGTNETRTACCENISRKDRILRIFRKITSKRFLMS